MMSLPKSPLERLLAGEQEQEEAMMSTGTPGDFASIDNLSPNLAQSQVPVQGASAGSTPQQGPQSTEPQEESQLQRLERLAAEMQQSRSKELEDANRRQMYQDMISGVNSNLGLIVGGAQAMNTKAAVQAPRAGEIKQRDLAGEVERRYKGDQAALMTKYKALLDAQKEAARLAQAAQTEEARDKRAMLMEEGRDRRFVEALNQRDQQFGRRQDYSEKKGDRLSDKQTEELGTIDIANDGIDKVLAEASKFKSDIGPAASRYESVKEGIPLVGGDPKFMAFKAETIETLSDYVKSKSGLQVTDAERKSLEAVLPSVTDSYDVFMAKAERFKAKLQEIRGTKIGNFEKQGKSIDRFREGQTQGPAQPNQNEQALNWAKNNPTDPRAKKILEKLGY